MQDEELESWVATYTDMADRFGSNPTFWTFIGLFANQLKHSAAASLRSIAPPRERTSRTTEKQKLAAVMRRGRGQGRSIQVTERDARLVKKFLVDGE